MSLVKDAFVIMYFLASTDGRIDERESAVIVDFINRNHGQINFDARRTLSDLTTLSGAGRIEEYERALFAFKANSSVQDRLTLLHFACDLAAADGSISEGERVLFQDMAKVWGIDLQSFFQQAGVSVAQANVPPAAYPPPIQVSYPLPPQAAYQPPPAASGYAPTASSPYTTAPPVSSGLGKKVNQGNFYAWTLGSTLSLYSIALTQHNPAISEAYFEKAVMTARALGLTVNPLTGMTGDPAENYVKVSNYLLKDEGMNLAGKMNANSGAMISDYFQIVVKSYILLLLYSPHPESRGVAESALSGIWSLKQYTAIPDTYFQPMVTAVRQGVGCETLKPIVYDFDAAVSKFLYNRVEA